MEMLKMSLENTLEENKNQLRLAEKESAKRIARDGDPSGNRHERRLAAKRARQSRRRVKA